MTVDSMEVSGGDVSAFDAQVSDSLQDLVGPYAHFVEDEQNTDLLWIVFSHIDIPENKFGQSHVFSHLSGSKLFLNCANNSWYQFGVGGAVDTIELLIDRLYRVASKYSRVRVVGHSMGAYMALILQNLFGVEAAIISSPEPLLNVPFSRSSLNGVRTQAGWQDLVTRFCGKTSLSPGLTLYGAFDPIDAYFLAQRESHSEIYRRIMVVPHHHGVTEYLTGHRVYLEVLSDIVSGAKLLEDKGLAAQPSAFGSVDQYMYLYRLHAAVQGNASPDQLKSFLAIEQDWDNEGWILQRALAVSKIGFMEQGADILYGIVGKTPSFFDPVSRLIEIENKIGSDTRKAGLAEKIVSLGYDPRVEQRFLSLLNLADTPRPDPVEQPSRPPEQVTTPPQQRVEQVERVEPEQPAVAAAEPEVEQTKVAAEPEPVATSPSTNLPAPSSSFLSQTEAPSVDHTAGPEFWEGPFELVDLGNGAKAAQLRGPAGASGLNVRKKNVRYAIGQGQSYRIVLDGEILNLPSNGETEIDLLATIFDADGAEFPGRKGLGVKRRLIDKAGPFQIEGVWNTDLHDGMHGRSASPAVKVNANSEGDPVIRLYSWSVLPEVGD